MNNNQMKKLMKKVGGKVERKFREKEAREREEYSRNMKEMKYNISTLQKEHPNRGRCCCVWKRNLYILENNRTVNKGPADKLDGLELLKTENNKQYFMFSEKGYEELLEFMNWISENYAWLKISVHKMQTNNNAKEYLESALHIGTIYKDFQKKFPNKTPMDLKEGIQTFDMILKQGLKDMEKKAEKEFLED